MKQLATFKKGTEAYLYGRPCRIVGTAGMTAVRVMFLDSGETVQTSIDNLWSELPESAPEPARTLDMCHPGDVSEATRRFEIIRPIIEFMDAPEKAGRIGDVYAVVNKQSGLGVKTLYRWVDVFCSRRLLADLAPRRRRKHKRFLGAKQEELVAEAVEIYLSPKRPSVKKVYEWLEIQCADLAIPPPHLNTFRRRLRELPPRRALAARHGAKAAADKYDQIKGHYPGADYPLAYVQIDHTLLDMTVVSSKSREPIGRVWLTVAIDIFSRMIVGFYLSFEAPSAFSVCMCIRRAFLPKESLLLDLKVNGDWPVWGFMRNLHADNGADFRSEVYKINVMQYGCNLNWRVVRDPHYGGHIERLIGTINTFMHDVPGTTFSNPRMRGEYDSEENAILDIDELEQLFCHWMVNVYHKRPHTELGCTPLEKWEAGIVGSDGSPGVGLQDRIEDPVRLAIEMLPFTERTVQRDGISWDSITYISEALTPYIRATEGRSSAKFKIRRDPRDISYIWFLDPRSGEFHRIFEETRQMQPISVWEHRRARELAAKRGRRNQTTADNIDAHKELNRLVEEAEKKTKTSKTERRDAERRRRNKQTLASEPRKEEQSEQRKRPRRLHLVVDNGSKAEDQARDHAFDSINDLDFPVAEEI